MERWSVFAVVLLMAGCLADDEGDVPPDALDPPAVGDTVGVVSRDLEAELPLLLTSSLSATDSAAELGTVRLLQSGEADGALMMTIELNAGRPGSHGWEIRDGDCAATTDSASTSPASRTTGVTGNLDVGPAGFGEASSLIPARVMDASAVGRSRYSLVVTDLRTPSAARVVACADL